MFLLRIRAHIDELRMEGLRMKWVIEAVVRFVSKTYGQQLYWGGHGLGDVYRSESEPQFPSKERMVAENPT
jgi:hypothetical protein